jgi:hypothetical protein
MAWAIFTRRFIWSRPGTGLSFHVDPSGEPQEKPHDVIEAALAAGAAVEVMSPARPEAKRLKRTKS